MSILDFAINHKLMGTERESARSELASLRAAAAERDDLKTAMKKMLVIHNERNIECAELHQHLDALYADLASATDYAYAPSADFDAHEAVTQLQERIAEQAAQLEQARDVMLNVAPDEPMNQDEQGGCVWCGGKPPRKQYGYATSNPKHHSNDCPWIAARAWLAANAPAPKSDSEIRFDSAQKYREALEQIERVWVSESVSDEHLAAMKMYTISARALNNADEEKDQAVTA